MRWKSIAGVALIVAAMGVRNYAERWFRTAGPVAVDEPLSLLPGHIGASFLAGYDARYRAGIDFGAPRELRFEKPNCIPLPYYPADDCSGIPAGLNVSWTLSSGGHAIKSGLADTTIWRGAGGPFLAFGVFNLKGGRRYKLDAEFANDGSWLARAQPRVSVHVWEPEFAKTFGLGIKVQLVKVFTRIGYGLSALIGLALVFSTFTRNSENERF
jgi:hypothetical protein